MRILALPGEGFPYQDCFYAAVRAQGIEVVSAHLAGGWFWQNLRKGDVLHLHWPSFSYAKDTAGKSLRAFVRYAALLLLVRARGGRIVWTAHNLYPHRATGPAWLDRIARRFTIAISSKVYAHSESAARIVADTFRVSAAKMAVIPQGHYVGYYPDTYTKSDARAALKISLDATCYLFFGGVEPYKNLPELIRAFVRARRDDDVLYLVGRCKDAKYKAEIRAAAAQEPGIHIVDAYVDDNAIQLYMAAADVVVLPYREVLTSAVAMLALSFGRPVIAPRMGFLSDVINAECGLLYEPRGNPDALTNALSEAREMTPDAHAIRDYAQTFNWDRAAGEFLNTL